MTIRQGKQIIANTQGTRNYDLLENKPKIDGVELSGEVTLDDLNVQSKLSAGTGIEIVDGVISNTQTKAEWGKITGNIAEQTDLQQELAKAGTPDDQTIIKTSENTLQAIGTIEKNKNLPKYDWIGTLAEYTSQNIEILYPDWVCYITDDLSGGTSVYTKSEVNELLDVKTNTDLGNLSSIGQAVLDAKQDIANLSQTLDTSTTKYPSNAAVKAAIDAKDSLPSQAGNEGKALITDGENAYWGDTSGVIIRDWSL